MFERNLLLEGNGSNKVRMAGFQQAVRRGKGKTHYILSQRPEMEVTFMPKN